MKIDNGLYNIYNMYGKDARVSVKMQEDAASLNGTQTSLTDNADKTANEAAEENGYSRRQPDNEKIENIAFDFKKSNAFNLVGANSKIEDMDVEKALSDMKKEDVLSQYSFFVKPSGNSGMGVDADGSVRKVIRDFNHM